MVEMCMNVVNCSVIYFQMFEQMLLGGFYVLFGGCIERLVVVCFIQLIEICQFGLLVEVNVYDGVFLQLYKNDSLGRNVFVDKCG